MHWMWVSKTAGSVVPRRAPEPALSSPFPSPPLCLRVGFCAARCSPLSALVASALASSALFASGFSGRRARGKLAGWSSSRGEWGFVRVLGSRLVLIYLVVEGRWVVLAVRGVDQHRHAGHDHV